MSKKRTVIQVGGQSGTLDNSKTLLIPTIKEETTDDRLTTVETVEHNDNDSSADVNENDKNENCNVPIKKIVFDEKDCEKIEDANDETTKPFKRRSSVENFGKFGLLTPALVLVPGIDGSDTLTQSFKDLQGKNRELKLAAAHIDDAINGRGRYGKARAIFKPKKGQFCFKVLDSQWFSKIVLLAIIVHTCLIFFEPPPVDGTSPAIFVLTVLCLFTYLLDVVLHIVFLTWPVFWSITENRWMRVEFIFLTMFTIDFIMLIVQELIKMRLAQPFRCLRVATLLCKLKNVGHIYDVVLSIAVKLATVFFVIALFILLFGAIGLHLFSMDYHNIGCNATAIVNCTDDPNNIYTGAFDQIGIAALRLFVLLTTENYPDFMLPSYSNNQYSFFYFAIFIFVGVFLLLAIMLAIIVDGYWAFAKKHVKMERSRERAELAKAWNLLDPLGKGMLDKKDDKFLTLFKLLRPKNTDDMNTQLIDFLDGDEDGFIDSFEWTTRLNETLSFEFEEDDSLGQRTLPRCCQVVTDGANRLVNSKIFSICILVLIVVHSILFCVRWWGMTWTQELIIHAIRTAIVSIFMIEIMLRIIGEGRGMLQILEILDLGLVVIAFVANVVWYTFSDNMMYRGACVVTSCLAVFFRMGFNSAQTKRLLSLVMKIFPVMFDLMVLVVIIFYFFSVIGWELFYGYSPDTNYDAGYYDYQCGLGFKSFPCSLLVVFQVMTTSNWHEIMNAAMLSTNEWACLYFVACYFVLELMIMNIFVAIAIEAFNKLATEKEMEQMIQGDAVSIDKPEDTFANTAKNFITDIFESSRNEPEKKPHHTGRRASHTSALSTLHSSENGSRVTVADAESEEEDLSDLTPQQRREKMLKKKMAKRKKKNAKNIMTKILVITAFKADTETEIDLKVGEEISVVEKRGDWWMGNIDDKVGWFPASHVKETKRTSPSPDSGNRSSSPKPAWDRRNSTNKSSPVKVQDSVQSGTPGDNKPSFHNAAMAAAATTHLRAHHQAPQQTLQQPRLKIKRRDTDWRKSILGDITVMNPEEVRELNKIMKSEMRYRGRLSSKDSMGVPSTARLSSTLDGSIAEEEGEADMSSKLNSTAPAAINLDKIPKVALTEVDETQEEDVDKGDSDKSETGKDMPSWMLKFANTHNINVSEDVKIDKSESQTEDNGPSLPGAPNVQTTEL